MDQQKPDRDPDIQTENGSFNFDLNLADNQSVQIMKSAVMFHQQDIIVNKFGAKHSSLATAEVNPDFIKEQKKIGRGSAGEVWLATYTLQGRQYDVAIKEIPVDHKQSRDQFIQDLKAFINCDSPYIVKFYGCYYKEGYLNEVIEYMDMGSLRDIINFNLSTKRCVVESILAQLSYCILSGLHYIHKQKHQIHRDIKPENILINSNGEVKITDFGIYKQLEKTYGLSKTKVGTQIYMSPERIQTQFYNSNCDVWSFGLVLYELATCKQLPYKKKSNEAEIVAIKKITNGDPPKFTPEDCRSPQFSHFLARCLEKDYKARASVVQLLQHPWLLSNINQKQSYLKPYIKMIKKNRQSPQL